MASTTQTQAEYAAAEREAAWDQCPERAARQKASAGVRNFRGADLGAVNEAALAGALAQIERAFGKGATRPASQLEAAA